MAITESQREDSREQLWTHFVGKVMETKGEGGATQGSTPKPTKQQIDALQSEHAVLLRREVQEIDQELLLLGMK